MILARKHASAARERVQVYSMTVPNLYGKTEDSGRSPKRKRRLYATRLLHRTQPHVIFWTEREKTAEIVCWRLLHRTQPRVISAFFQTLLSKCLGVSKCLRVPSWIRMPAVGMNHTTKCPSICSNFRIDWRSNIFDPIPLGEREVLVTVVSSIELCHRDLVDHGDGAM